MEFWKNTIDLNLDDEIWKDVEEFPDYQISNYGRVKSFMEWHGTNERILKQCKNNKYLVITLCQNGNQTTKYIHILEFEIFNDYKLKDNECVHHIDKNPNNNFICNLIKMNKSDHNIFHHKNKILSEEIKNKISINHDCRKGENHPLHKLIEQDIYDIRRSLELKLYTQKQLSWIFDISIGTISLIKSRKVWCNI